MATDGPKPRVPPPPTLTRPASEVADEEAPSASSSADDDAWLALIEDDPTSPKETAVAAEPEADAASSLIEDEPTAPKQTAPDENADTIVAAPKAEPEPANAPELTTDLEADAEVELEEVAEPRPPPRRGMLPMPKSDGKRVQPLSSKGMRRTAPKGPSATGLPSGVVPPGVPEERERADTDVLIASAVAALTEGADEREVDIGAKEDDGSPVVAADSVSFPAPVESAPVVASAAPEPTPASAESSSNRRMLWVGIAGVAAAILLLVLVTRDGDETPATPAAATQSDARPTTPANAVAVVADANPDVEPEPNPAPVATPPDLGAEPLAVADALDVGTDLALALDVGSAEDQEDAPVELAEAAPEPEPGKVSNRGRKGRKKPKSRPSADVSRPPPARPTASAEPDAKTLLADARKALASGQARRAYTLASKSKKAKHSSAALVVMAKAACRFGGESQAKSAFKQLSVSDRRGIRSECRNNGIRLGL